MIILIVEDSPEVVGLWQMLLKGICREFRVAETVPDALRLMAKEPYPDLVLLDLRLPGSTPENTLAHIERFKKVSPGVVVLVITGNPDNKLPELAALAGADGFAPKLEVASQERLLVQIKRAFARTEVDATTPRYQRRMELFERLSRIVTPDEGSATLSAA